MTDTYELEIDIDASRSRVWEAMTDARQLEAWFCEHADVALDDLRYDFWGRFTQGAPDREQGRNEVVAVEEMRRICFRFPYDGARTLVDITLEGDTTVRVVHSEVAEPGPESQMLPRHLWSAALSQLRAYIETGRAGPRFDYTWPTTGMFSIHADIDAPRDQVYAALHPDRWTDEQFRRPPRNDDEDFGWDVGAVVGIKVLDLVPGERIELAWIQDTATTLTYTLEESSGRTRVTLVHSGFGGETDEQGMAEGFFGGLVEVAWALETKGAWPPPAVRLDTPFAQSGWKYGVRVLQSTSQY